MRLVPKSTGSFRIPRQVRPYYRMEQVANILEEIVMHTLKWIVYAVEIVLIDAAFGKSRFRKRFPRMRHVVHKTIVVRTAPRVVVVHK